MTTHPLDRDPGLDALRAAVTLLVVFHHAALTYGAIGGWFYQEIPQGLRPATALLVLFCTVNQAWFMGLFFFLAGYFTPRSVERHGTARYVRERLLRLGLPLLAFGLVIGPLTIAMAQTVKGHAMAATLWWLWTHRHFENGPLWFAQALLIFGLLYLAVPWRGGTQGFPSNRAMAAAALATGAGAFALRLFWPVGTTQFGLQLGYFAGYAVLFAAGCSAARGNWLAAVPDRQRRLWQRIALAALPLFPAAVLLLPGTAEGGFNPQAIVYAFWEPLVAWGAILFLLHRFRAAAPSWPVLSRRAYAIFIVHPPVLVAVAMSWRDVPAPPLVKFAVTGTLSCLACYAVAGALLRVPGLRRVV